MGGRSTDTAAAYKGVAVTKSDATILPATRGLWVGGAGNLSVIFADGGSAVSIVGVAAGTLVPIQVTKVMDATTATDIVALY